MPIPAGEIVERLPNAKLAICVDGVLRAATQSSVCRRAVSGRLSLQAGHYVRVGDKKEAVVEFNCPLVHAAVICDMVRRHDVEVGEEVTDVYIDEGRGWRLVKYGVWLIVDGRLNPEIFEVKVQAVEAIGLDEVI